MPDVTSLRDEYVAALVEPDARRARTLVTNALERGAKPHDVYLDVLAPALYEIGLRWERGDLSIAGEHLASSVTEAVMAELAGRMRRGAPRRGTAVVACVGEELHRLGSRIVADFLEAEGWDVDYLGAMVPVEHIVAASSGASVVALSVTLAGRVPDLARACDALKRLDPPPFVAAGGQGLAGADVPADLVSHDPRELVRRAAGLTGRTREHAPQAPGERPDPYVGETELVQQVLRLNDDLVRARREIARQRDELARVAETLQAALLPDAMPRIAGVELAFRYVPGTTDGVGGDWYDAVELPGGELLLAIGDVAGKGVEAAALMGDVRSAMRAYALDESDPARLLAKTDRLVERSGHMVTALLAVLDPRTGVLRYASAGHLPPLLIGAGGTARFLDGGAGRPLLIYGTGEAADVHLAPGDRLVLFTDGLVERRDEALTDSLERLRAAAPTGGDLDALCDTLAAGAPSGRARDDVALLACQLAP